MQKNVLQNKIIVENEKQDFLKAMILLTKVYTRIDEGDEKFNIELMILIEAMTELLTKKMFCPTCKNEILFVAEDGIYKFINPEILKN
jgi:uncharacterized protein with PIN domain